jgi:hypothetical protein
MLDDSERRRKRALATARTRRWRAKHREAWKAYVREYQKRPNARATQKAYVERNRERLKAQARARKQANPEAARAKASKYRQRKREREEALMAADPSYVPPRRAYMREYGRKWRAANREKCRKYERRRRLKRHAKAPLSIRPAQEYPR